MIAVQNGYCEVVRILLEAGAAANLADSKGNTALHTAAFKSHGAVVRMLLAAGADPNRTTRVRLIFALFS